AFATSKSARFGAASPTYLCERFCTSSTRLLFPRVVDTLEQSRAVMQALADDDAKKSIIDYAPWHALQAWLPPPASVGWAVPWYCSPQQRPQWFGSLATRARPITVSARP